MGNWWDNPTYAAQQAASGKGVKKLSSPNNSGSANSMEYRLGQIKSAPKPKNNGGYLSSNGAVPFSSTPVDYQAMARDIYEPSLDYLTGQVGQAKSRNAGNDRELASMYGGLVKSIAGDAKGIGNNYNSAIGQIASGTRDAVGAVDNTYDESANEQMAMLKQLGIQAAAPDTLAANTRDESFFKNMLSTQGKSVADMLRSNKVGALEYNTAQQNISRQSGVDARAQNKLSLEDTLNQIMGQRANLETTINQQASQMQSSATDQLLKQMQAAQAQANNDRNYQLNQGKLMLDTAKFQAGSQTASANANKPSDPWGKLTQLAGSLYGSPQATQNAVSAIRDTITANGQQGKFQWSSPAEFIQDVLDRNRGANDSKQLVELATYAYQQMFGK